jgi:NADPH:quinone reductase-like Zn-dependent oxidoreductase
MDLIVDTVADSENNPSFFKVKKTRGRLVRLDITSCGQKYVPRRPNASIQEEHGLMKKLFDSYKERVINDKAIKYDIFHSFNDDKELFTEDLAYLLRLLQIGKIRPRIFSRVSFNELEGKWVEGEWQKVMSAKANGVVLVLPGRMV